MLFPRPWIKTLIYEALDQDTCMRPMIKIHIWGPWSRHLYEANDQDTCMRPLIKIHVWGQWSRYVYEQLSGNDRTLQKSPGSGGCIFTESFVSISCVDRGFGYCANAGLALYNIVTNNDEQGVMGAREQHTYTKAHSPGVGSRKAYFCWGKRVEMYLISGSQQYRFCAVANRIFLV